MQIVLMISCFICGNLIYIQSNYITCQISQQIYSIPHFFLYSLNSTFASIAIAIYQFTLSFYLFLYFWPHCMVCGIEPMLPALESGVLTTGLAVKSSSLFVFFFKYKFIHF